MGRPRGCAGRYGSLVIDIRKARSPDLEHLTEIELSAGEAFRGTSQEMADGGEPLPLAFVQARQAEGLVWVAEDDGRFVGMAVAQRFDDALHLWELAVRLEDQKRGAGHALVVAVIAEAAALGAEAMTLTTFRDIAFNGPFYGSRGFTEIPADALNIRLRNVFALETAHGLDVKNRCAMRRAV